MKTNKGGVIMKKPIAYLGVCNTISLNIYEVNEPEEYVLVGYNNDKPEKAELGYDDNGVFFDWNGEIYYLDEFMRTDYPPKGV